MIALGGPAQLRDIDDDAARVVVRLTRQADRPKPLRAREGFIFGPGGAVPEGFRFYVGLKRDAGALPPDAGLPVVLLSDEYDYLESGDVIRIEPKTGRIRVLYRRASLNNYFLVTERCNSFCLMCSQPPRKVQDDWIVDEIAQTIPLMDPATKEIGFTGGEPTLLGDRFLRCCGWPKATFRTRPFTFSPTAGILPTRMWRRVTPASATPIL